MLPCQTCSESSLPKLVLKTLLISIGLSCLLIISTGLLILMIAWSRLNIFTLESGTSWVELKQTITDGWQLTPPQSQHHYNLLILGLDQVENRTGDPPLTDVMMLVSVDLASGQISSLAIPRDLWSETYQTKVNALYTYGVDRYPATPQQFPAEVIGKLTKLELHHTLVVSLDQLSQLVDLVGGIEVDVPQGFTDETYPRPDVDIRTETDPKVLYEKVHFAAGRQIMDGPTALKYIRSRHSQGETGTDISRGQRQQLVLQALFAKIQDKSLWLDTTRIGQLYRYYLDTFATEISPAELVAVVKALIPYRHQIKFENHVLNIYPEEEEGIITHPDPNFYQGQWVYVIRDQTVFQQKVYQLLYE